MPTAVPTCTVYHNCSRLQPVRPLGGNGGISISSRQKPINPGFIDPFSTRATCFRSWKTSSKSSMYLTCWNIQHSPHTVSREKGLWRNPCNALILTSSEDRQLLVNIFCPTLTYSSRGTSAINLNIDVVPMTFPARQRRFRAVNVQKWHYEAFFAIHSLLFMYSFRRKCEKSVLMPAWTSILIVLMKYRLQGQGFGRSRI